MKFLNKENELLELLDLTEMSSAEISQVDATGAAVLMMEIQVFPNERDLYHNNIRSCPDIFFKGAPVLFTCVEKLLINCKCKVCGSFAFSIRRMSNTHYEFLCEYHTNIRRLCSHLSI